MSNIKFSTGLFLEKAELERFKKFVQTDGFVKYFLQNSTKFGLIKNPTDNTWENAKIVEGTSFTITQKAISAFDKDGNFIYKAQEQNIPLPTLNDWYWLKIGYTQSTYELGKYSIDVNGNLVCTSGNGELTKILRGQPNFPSRVSLQNSTNNTLDYDVLEVIDDNNAILQGYFIAESDLSLVVVGTFAPGFVAPPQDKNIFEYDSCTMQFVLETVVNTPPSGKLDQYEFYIARVKSDGSSLEIEDKRLEIYQSKDNFFLRNLTLINNPVIGVENIKYSNKLSTQDENIVSVAWGLRSTNWSFNPKLNLVTFNAAEGGRYKLNDVSLFTNGDLDGWRLYTANGKWHNISSSSKAGSQLNFYLDTANLDDFSILTDELLVVPNAEEIEISFSANPSDNTELPNKKEVFPINLGVAKIPLLVYLTSGALYNFSYRYKQLRDYSPRLIPQLDSIGFYNENQFDVDGNLIISPTRTTYISDITGGYIPVRLAPASYYNVIGSLSTGDILGVNTTEIQPGTQVTQLFVGTDKKYQHFYKDTPATLIQDIYFNLNSTKSNGDPLKEGNSFIIHLQQDIAFTSYKIHFVQNYVDNTTHDKIHTLDIDLEPYLTELFINSSTPLKRDGLMLLFTYNDNSKWIVKSFNEDRLVALEKSVNGRWVSVDPIVAAGLVLSNPAITWTTANAHMVYKVIGKTMTVSFAFDSSSFSAAGSTLSFTIPGGYIASNIGYFFGVFSFYSGGSITSSVPLFCSVETGLPDRIRLNNFLSNTSTVFSLAGQITFEIN